MEVVVLNGWFSPFGLSDWLGFFVGEFRVSLFEFRFSNFGTSIFGFTARQTVWGRR